MSVVAWHLVARLSGRAVRTPPVLALLALTTACGPGGLPFGPGRLELARTVADFGTLALGDATSEELVLRNVGGADVTVLSMDVFDVEGTGFSLDGALPLVPGHDTAILPVRYAPTVAGYHLAELTLVTDEADENVHIVELIGVAGTPTAQVWPLVMDYGPVPTGGTATQLVTLVNDSVIDVQVGAAAIDGAGFALAVQVPFLLGAGATEDFPVVYTAADPHEAMATLTFALGGGATVAPVTLRANACTTGEPARYDTDDDGFSSCATDCDDTRADVHPGGTEVCDGVDQDCDARVDEGTRCADDDGDGVTEDGGDCNDGAAAVFPGASERSGNGIDDDCDGVVDQGTADTDGDGYAEAGGDCAPSNAAIYPGAAEIEDGVDNDCDGTVDEGTEASDDDDDGHAEDAGDCDDTDSSVFPGAQERANGVDDDCDGRLDEGTNAGDDDDDGWSENGGDCDDRDDDVHPGAEERAGNGVDDDCDGSEA
ncbi:MAG: MopE-related protein [Pseudomonadota bacterium]|nr:MopE-related protein [Pseudomonadota bacterium]